MPVPPVSQKLFAGIGYALLTMLSPRALFPRLQSVKALRRLIYFLHKRDLSQRATQGSVAVFAEERERNSHGKCRGFSRRKAS